MTTAEALKGELLDLCRRTDGGFGTSTAPWLERIRELMEALATLNPEPAPLASPHLDGRWRTEFASFAIKPAAGEGIRRESTLAANSFGRLPPAAIRVTDIYQDVERASGTYNNVVEFDVPGSPLRGELITWGRFSAAVENPCRAVVAFSGVLARPRDGAPEAEFRAALGLDDAAPLQAALQPPRLHSDVVYLDAQLRVNIGSLGGNYVLTQTGQPAPTAARVPA